jgi:hypothetical protein
MGDRPSAAARAKPCPHQRVAAWWLGQLKKRDLVTIIPDPRTGSLGPLRNPPRFLSEMEESSGNSGYRDRMVLHVPGSMEMLMERALKPQ